MLFHCLVFHGLDHHSWERVLSAGSVLNIQIWQPFNGGKSEDRYRNVDILTGDPNELARRGWRRSASGFQCSLLEDLGKET